MMVLLFSNSFGIFILSSWIEQMQALWYLFLFISWQQWGFLALIWSSMQCCEGTVCQNRENYAVYDCWKWKLFVGVFFDSIVIQTISLPKTTERETAYYKAEKLCWRTVSPQKTVVYINEDLQAWGRIADILKVTQHFLSSSAPFQSTPKGSYIFVVPTLLKTQHFYQLCRFEKNSLKKKNTKA